MPGDVVDTARAAGRLVRRFSPHNPWDQSVIVEALVVCIASLVPQDPAAALAELRADPALDGARVGVFVRDLAGDRVVVEHDSDYGFMTASNMKLVSIAVALATLGAEFRFRTSLVATGPVRGGVLSGDLVLVGAGDPTFGGRQEGDDPRAVLQRLVATAVREHGLRRVTGDVLGDDDFQPDEVMGDGWSWNYEGDDYAAQVSGLCFAENCARVTLTPSAPGSAPRVALSPPSSYLETVVDALCVEGEVRARPWARRERARNRIRIGGRMASDAKPWSEKLSVENPTAFAATVLLETLRAQGVEVAGIAADRDERPERAERYGDETILAVHGSAPLREVLVTLGKVSQNLYAEQVLRAAAPGDHGMSAAAAHAKVVLQRFGVDPRGMRIADGSGLSRLDLVRPRQLGELLTGIWRSDLRTDFVRALPVAGVDGTLASRFRGTPAEGRVVAKTGNISGVTALSGYVPRADDVEHPLVFVVLLNDFTSSTDDAKAALDRFVVALVGSADRR